MVIRDDEYYMGLALREARRGLGRTSPNPCVGAVIVKDGQIIGKGYHKRAGTPHAEINAINSTNESLTGATIYVTLEPCNHTGRTPPCSHALVAAGFSRVVVGMQDPNPAVNGSGNSYLQSNGIEVVSGVLEPRCREINQPFIKHITQRLPWVIMKAGQTLDGRLTFQQGQMAQITGKEARAALHRLRDRVDAILVGSGTVMADNPSLTTRLMQGKGKHPTRVVLDTRLKTDPEARVYHQTGETARLVFCLDEVAEQRKRAFRRAGVEVIGVGSGTGGVDLRQVLAVLGKRDVCSLLVEGGGGIHGSFLSAKLYDAVQLFVAPTLAGENGDLLASGVAFPSPAFAPRLRNPKYRRLGEDLLVSGEIDYSR